ncbi:hypothetical protein EYR38_006560 [Pleurotus pulmonarius]|nr:hypothetical protein EYR38_006560 [Pleurotus pulmonarius]
MASSSMDSGSKKRKRDDDRPRITYFASGRTFERLFKEESLEETKSVVRRKLGVPENADILLAQIRDNQTIDLDDDDDFEAFASLAYTTMKMSVLPVQTPAAGPVLPPPTPPAATTNPEPPVAGNAPEISTSTPTPSSSTRTRRGSISAASAATFTDGVEQPAPKRRKRETAKDRLASDHSKKTVSFVEPAAPPSNVESAPPAGDVDVVNTATNGQAEPTEVEPTPPAPAPKKRGRKKKVDNSAPEAAVTAEITSEVQGISTLVTDGNWIPYVPLEPVVKKTRKPRASTAEISKSTSSTEAPPTVPLASETAPEAQPEDPSVAPKKKSKRISQKKGKELPAASEAVVDSGGDQTLHDASVSDTAPSPKTPKPKSSAAAKPVSKAKSKPASANGTSPAGTKVHPCPICLQAPYHFRFQCPVVKSPSSLKKRVRELRGEPEKVQLLETLETLLLQGTSRPSTVDKSPRVAPHTSTSTDPAAVTPGLSKPSVQSTDKTSTKKATKKKPVRAPSIDITLTSPPKDHDLANIDPELLLQGSAKRWSITDIPSSDSEEEEEDSGVQDLEQDDDDDEVRPPRRRKRGTNEGSSSDEENDGAMDVDSSPDDISFKTVDRLGQSVEMDMSPDNAMNERASLIPDVRTVSEDAVPAKDDSEKRTPEAQSSQKPSSVGPTQSSSNSKEDALLDRPNGVEHAADTTIPDAVAPKKTTPKPVSKVSQTRADGTPKVVYAMKDRHGQLPPRTAKDILNATAPETTPLQPTPPPDLETTARRRKSKATPKTPAPKQTTKSKPTKAKAIGKSKMSIDALLSKESSFTTPHSTQEQDLSLAEWETLPVSPSLATDPGLDELDAGDLSYMFTSTPLPNVGSTPLFLPSSSQAPLASQIRKIAESDGEEEEEVENTVKDLSRQSSRQTSTAYRRLTDIARQPLFTQELVVQPPRFAKGRIDKLKLYGSSQQEVEDSSSGSDSDSDKATPSHIPPSKRAGMAKTPR